MTFPGFRSTCLAIMALGFTGFAVTPARAVGPDQAKAEQMELVTARKDSKITLEDGINASQKEGNPISAKFEMEDKLLRFSAYTMKGDDFTEVVVDPGTGEIKSAEKITDPEDLANAKAQKNAMEKSSIPLLSAAQRAAKENTGARLISITPELKEGKPSVSVVLVGTAGMQTISEKLN